jgi:hypothetical protein
MKVKFWGVRGSIASPGPETALVGGNTSCVEVTAGATRIALDAGTGLRALGNELLRAGARRRHAAALARALGPHPGHSPSSRRSTSPDAHARRHRHPTARPGREVLRRQMSDADLPRRPQRRARGAELLEVRDRQRFRVGEAEVTVARANHPDQVYAWRIEHGGRAVVYATDTEHYRCVDPRLVALARGADVLIYDAQYLPDGVRRARRDEPRGLGPLDLGGRGGARRWPRASAAGALSPRPLPRRRGRGEHRGPGARRFATRSPRARGCSHRARRRAPGARAA